MNFLFSFIIPVCGRKRFVLLEAFEILQQVETKVSLFLFNL